MNEKINSEFYTFENAEKMVDEFEEILKKHGIEIKNRSDLERVCLNVKEIRDLWANPPEKFNRKDIRRNLSEVMGLMDLIRKIIWLHKRPGFIQLLPYFSLLNEGSVPQNTESGVTDQASNKLFELLIGLICLAQTDELTIDDPYNSKGDNPDVIALIDGVKWGFACKAIHSQNPLTIWDNIEKGNSQIENSEAEKGVTILNFKNVINHKYLWPIINEQKYAVGEEAIYGAYTNIFVPIAELIDTSERLLRQIDGFDEHETQMYSGKVPAGVLCFLQTGVSINYNDVILPVTLGTLNYFTFNNVVYQNDLDAFKKLNLALHNCDHVPSTSIFREEDN